MVSKKELEAGTEEKRGMNPKRVPDDDGPIPAELADTYQPVEKKIKISTVSTFTVKNKEGTRIFNRVGTHFEVEDGIMYVYNGDDEIGVFGLTNFAVEITKRPSQEEVN